MKRTEEISKELLEEKELVGFDELMKEVATLPTEQQEKVFIYAQAVIAMAAANRPKAS